VKTLQECLADHDTTLLRAIAERWGIDYSTNQQPEMIQELVAAMLQPEAIHETLEWLTGEERTILDTLVINGGRMRIHRFEQQAGQIRRFGPGSLAREAPWRSPASAAEGLWYRGLIARGFAEEADTVVEFAFVPSDLRPLLPPPQIVQDPFEVPSAPDPHSMRLGTPAAIDDVCTILSLAYSGTLSRHDGQLSETAMTTLQAQALDPDPARLAFLFDLARSASLLRVQGRMVQMAREQARGWLQEERARQLRVLQEAWRGNVDWNDLWHVPSIRCEPTGWHNDPVAGRAAVLDLVRRCPPDTWLSIPGFVEAVKDQAADYLRPDGDFESWYIRDSRSNEFVMGFEHWERVEGALLTYCLTGPLYWLGIVSLGYPEGWEKPAAFRITVWGAAFLGLPFASLQDLPPQPASITPTAAITIDREASLYDRFQLARIAEWQQSDPAYVYAITPVSLEQALGSGVQLEQMERFLNRISQDTVPEQALERIRSWTSRYGIVRLRRAVLLEARSPQTMSELRRHGRIKGYLRQSLSPTMSLVRASDWDALRNELHRAGYLPEIIEHSS